MPLFAPQPKQKKANANGKLWDFLKYFDDTGIEPVEITDEQYYELNEAAGEDAVRLSLEDPERRDQITNDLKSEPRGEVAMSCIYHHQIETLDLKPWQTPPSYLDLDLEKFDDILAKPDPNSDYTTVLLTLKLIKLGVSVYSPDPIAALKNAVKQARRGRPPR
jgi:hypothetical protein